MWILQKVHGDIKGDNVLISDDGKLKLTDFGLTVMGQEHFLFSRTSPGGGTLNWMAPELFTDHGVRSKETDMYALAMTMLEIITCEVPFKDLSFLDFRKIQAIAEQGMRPPRPDDLLAASPIGAEFWLVIEQCWAPVPSERLTAREAQFRINFLLAALGWEEDDFMLTDQEEDYVMVEDRDLE
ncbi:hypothetical protein FRC07_001497 [Ceratobasidium sp. 392]|nr:hypothetical protein FRC07_001497 [Ceratobasidium sp. 392]